jgi:hypothetical protein
MIPNTYEDLVRDRSKGAPPTNPRARARNPLPQPHNIWSSQFSPGRQAGGRPLEWWRDEFWSDFKRLGEEVRELLTWACPRLPSI